MNPSLSLWQRFQHARNSLPLTQTFAYYAAFIALGLTTASLGPTLLGLAEQTGSALSEISFLFTARSFGYLVGSFIGGRLLDRLPGHVSIATALLVIAVALAAIPLAPLLWILLALVLVIGFTEAVVDVGGNTLIVWVHRDRVGPYMNGLHLFFAVGAFLSPLLIAQAILMAGNFGWGYWLLALLLVPIALRFIRLPNPQPIVSHQERASARPNYLLVALIAAFLTVVAGAEISYAGWVATYAVKSGMADAATAALLTSAFWGAFTVGRIASIPIAARVRPRIIILADLILALGGIGIVIAFPLSVFALWGGTMIFGLGIASAFPTILTFAGRHLTITATVMGLFFGGASFGNILTPTLIGQLFERVGPASVLWVIAVMLVAAVGVFAAILAFVKKHETQ